MKSFPKPLSAHEETEMLEKCHNGDLLARETLIERNLRLVAHIVKKYISSDKDTDDLISIGTIGLIKAIDTFRTDKQIRLATYAARCIENELLMLMRSSKKQGREVYLYEPIGSDKEGNEISLLDILETYDEDIAGTLELEENTRKLYVYMNEVLSTREKEILKLRYGLYGQKEATQREIAAIYNISRSYVSRIEKHALEKLKMCYERDKD